MDETLNRLKRVLEAAATTLGNRDRFLEAGLIHSEDCLQLSPDWQQAFLNLRPIDKETVRESPGLFLADVDDIVYRGATSGSRGQSFIYFAGTKWNELRISSRHRALEWWGIDDNTPIINVASRMQPVRAIDVAIAGEPNEDFIHTLNSLITERPVVIRGYPSRLCEVATRFNSKSTPSVIAVICTGECLFEYQQALLEKVFQAPVINEYGCQETGIFGLTCPEAGHLHLDGERCLYEVIDGQLVTTDLFNLVMPVVRYKCGDLVELNTEPCSCGRPGFTAKVLGRIEDNVRTIEGLKRPGEISMPALEGILNYQIVRREGTQIDVWIQPEDSVDFTPQSLEPLVNWMDATFGEVRAEIFLDDAQEMNTAPEPLCKDAFWIRCITKESWAKWLNEPRLPKGAAFKAAQLLKKLVEPGVIVGSGLPPTTQAMVTDILDSPPCKEPQVERMTARVLLFACNFLADEPEVVSIYHRAAERLKRAVAQIGQYDGTAIVDLLVPTLFLETHVATAIWAECPLSRHLQCLDTFNVHNLLYAFEPALRRANASGSKTIVRSLKPILSILIGDLNFFAPRFGTWLLAHWGELIHGQAIASSPIPEAPKDDDFLAAWLTWRQDMISGGQHHDLRLSALADAARSHEEQARVYLEKGYDKLVRGEELHPHQWLDILGANAGILSQGLPSDEVDPIPWAPIMRSLVKPLQMRQEYELAYQCLVASAIPSSRTSAFERLALKVNDKQSVIYDLVASGII
ncbi:hypothetical protein H6F98_04350 [Microcoleus sp. FACHB-SPT15]|uniref:hypothetical protein n=1 Tax=Microcoleus sp. FACHB-SPT15 TaxID=2692830 RepID=UPI0017874611|nr:hypothetical protein [Microcoleus sp. FACHB-SPT15]MBD1804704.1 hypothetical protein [Microcoleus sp. FACHB-SPT15]